MLTLSMSHVWSVSLNISPRSDDRLPDTDTQPSLPNLNTNVHYHTLTAYMALPSTLLQASKHNNLSFACTNVVMDISNIQWFQIPVQKWSSAETFLPIS